MGRIAVFILALFVLTSFTGPGDPPEVGISFNSFWKSKSVAIAGYTKINARYEWVAGAFDSGLHVPQYNGVPSGTRSGVWNADGAVAVDTSNHRLYFYSGGSWRYSTSGTGGGTPTLQQVLTAGSTLTTNHTVDAGSTIFKIKLDEDQDFTGFEGLNYNGIIGFKNGQTVVSPGTGGILMNAGYMYLESVTSGKISSQTIYGDSIVVRPFRGQYYIDSLNYTLSTIGKKIMLRDTATGLVQNIDPALLGGVNIYNSDGTLTGDRTVDGDGNYLDVINTSSFGIKSELGSSYSAIAGSFTGSSAILNLVASNNSSTYESRVSINQDSILLAPKGGVLNIDTLLTTTDTTNFKPMAWRSSNGQVKQMTYWPGGGGGGWGTTGTVATLTGASTLSMGTNNFTFASTGDANLIVADASQDEVHIGGSTDLGDFKLQIHGGVAFDGTGGDVKMKENGSGTFEITGNVGKATWAFANWFPSIRVDAGYIELTNNASLRAYSGNIGFLTDAGYASIMTAGGAASKALIVKGTAAQTANLQEWQNVSGTALALVKSNGNIEVPTETYDATAWNGSLEVPTKDAIRDKIESMGTITESTYTPTLTNTTNIAASTAYTTYYQVIGDVVHVWGDVSIDATTALSVCEMGFSLPVATAIGNTFELAGTASFEDNTSVQIKGDATNDRAVWRFIPQTGSNNRYSFHFTYKYIAP